jgi:RimJ/RimL family protein N-acetyltransferase
MGETLGDDTLRLRDVEDADLEVFLEYEHDPEAVRRSRFTPRERDAFMTHWRTRVLQPPGLVQTVMVNGEVAGNIVSWWNEDRRFVGYWFGRPLWGKGIGTRALTQFLDVESTRPLYADPYVGNTASVRLLERCGFRREGTVHHDGDEFLLLVLHDDHHGGSPLNPKIERSSEPAGSNG